MKAVVFHAIGHIRLDDVPEPELQQPTAAIVRLTTSAICGTDLQAFDKREPGWIKVALNPMSQAAE